VPPAAQGSAVVPPVVPGRAGARTPALPGRAGAMAGGATSGVIPRPGETSGGRTGVPQTGSTTGAIPTGAIPTGSMSTGSIGVGGITGSAGVGAVSGSVSAGQAGVAQTGVAQVGAGQVGAGQVSGAVAAGRVVAGAAEAAGSDPGREPVDDRAAVGGIRGARSELRRQMREKRRLRMITLSVLTLVVLLALPAFFGIRSASRDPVFHSLDALSVPAWASSGAEDRTSGSRWCFLECRFRERTAQSQKAPAETEKTYQQALSTAGWQRWKVAQCPEQPTQGYSCWKRDEFTLDLWVRQPSCAVDAVAGAAPVDGALPDPKKCVGATVSIKVRNAITDERGRPQPTDKPPLIGETPDVIITDDPLLEATPSPS
jgi:integrin beta 3